MKLQFGNEILASYKRLSYKAWYALAEFVDNSTQAYLNHKAEMDAVLAREGTRLKVDIIYDVSNGVGNEVLVIEDNSIGMNEKELEKALIIGMPPDYRDGRSRYGLGMKTAAFWFGESWSIRTKKLGDDAEYFVEFDIANIVANQDEDLALDVKRGLPAELHYTVIKITQLNRKISAYTKSKIKEYLGSFYRYDFHKYGLLLRFNGEEISWDFDAVIARLLKDYRNSPLMKKFDFAVNGKRVHGWAGVFANGSRKDAGFSIIQADRVIKGWPDSYKPGRIFGFQEGGSNNLISQRLVGELFLEGFEVSHTKDTILFSEDEEDEIENKLIENIGDLIKAANEYRKSEAIQVVAGDFDVNVAVQEVLKEINSRPFAYVVEQYEVAPEKVIVESNNMVADQAKSKGTPTIQATIGQLTVTVFFNEDTSPYEPYLITKSTSNEHEVLVIINKLHPYWATLTTSNQVYNYVRHCIYDGVAEWKAWFIARTLNPETIKNIKDQLLRVPLEIEKEEQI
jgi:Histidine kinase-, DNA gyrase B-, and HSP90-like ATPase